MGNGLGIAKKVAVFNRVVWVGLMEKVTLEQRLGMEVRSEPCE